MASNSSKNNESDAERSALPFEPKRRKSAEKASKQTPAKATKQDPAPARKQAGQESMAIPDSVSRRMIRRMAFFCGVPTALGISSFVVSYAAVSHGVDLPNTAVLLVSLGLFGLGVLGLSYGVLSSSWDETTPGGLVGFEQFQLNFGRMTSAWRESRQDRQSNS
ncbi:MAG: PAM68 family protein [Cyanobacteria bacterium J06638_22]